MKDFTDEELKEILRCLMAGNGSLDLMTNVTEELSKRLEIAELNDASCLSCTL